MSRTQGRHRQPNIDLTETYRYWLPFFLLLERPPPRQPQTPIRCWNRYFSVFQWRIQRHRCPTNQWRSNVCEKPDEQSSRWSFRLNTMAWTSLLQSNE